MLLGCPQGVWRNRTEPPLHFHRPRFSLLTLLRQSDTRLLLDHLRRRLDDLLRPQQLGPIAELLREYVLASGKRIRPQLCLWTYNLCAESADDDVREELLDAACAWELFHAFLLIHDDIIDEADHRRGEPSLHRQLAALDSNSSVFGRNLGIVAGDLLFAASMRLWQNVRGEHLDRDARRELVNLFSRIGLDTGAGQAADITQSHAQLSALAEADVLLGYQNKTAAYTFEGPMLSGGLLGNLPLDARSHLQRFALAIGQAYQIENDLLDLEAPLHDGCDLAQGKRTLTLLRARAKLDTAGQSAFDGDLATMSTLKPAERLERAETMRQTLRDTGAIHDTRDAVVRLLTVASDHANDRAVPPRLREGLGQLICSLSESYFKASVEHGKQPAQSGTD